jgi:hypothetical protein
MPQDPGAVTASIARELLRVLSEQGSPLNLRVAEAEGQQACLILVWNAKCSMPTVGAERQRREGGRRAECKDDVVEVVRTAGRALPRKQVVRFLKDAGKKHGPSTVAKALAELTKCGELVNPKDKKGYRLPGWIRPRPALFH